MTRIAVVGPFSGPRAPWGELLKRAATAHGRPEVSWDFHDDRGDADHAAHVAEAVVADGGYTAVIGHFNSMGAGRALPHYSRAGLPLLLPLATAPGLLNRTGGAEDGRGAREADSGRTAWALRWCPHDTGQAEAIMHAISELGHGRPEVVDDGSAYGRQIADRVRLLSGGGAASVQEADAAVVCGTHFGAAATARRLRTEGFGGRLFFTDDCAVEDFARLLGPADARDARVVRIRGGAYAHVEAAFDCLVRTLGTHPTARGEQLLAHLRRHAGVAFDRHGDPVDAAARTTDVLVVGSGVVGSAVAAELTRSGLSVVIASPGPEAPSATAWSGGLVRAYDPDPVVRALAVRSHLLLWGASPERASACGFHRTGSLVLLGPGDLPEAERGLRNLHDAGIEAELLTPAAVRGRWPDLRLGEEVAGAVWEPGGGYADPSATAAMYRTRAVRYGASLPACGPVLALAPHRCGVEAVTAAGTVTARCAVVAAGSGTSPLLGDRLRLGPNAPAPRTKRIRYAFFDCSDRRLPAVNDLTTGVWGRPHLDAGAAGSHLIGCPVEEWDVPAEGGESLTDDEITHIREGTAHRWPWVTGAAFLGGRFGTDLYHPDGPFLGLLPGEPPVVVAACWSGAGFKTAPGAATEAAEAVHYLLKNG
ncbi:FAD-dependent oxidoreductase [Streptomyces sp. URMC 125]|uniref:FAD-dependent oxidoreductase n=1 Tax=Streptomyces sp. URMC 125 TaxID=3423419 RepID=UPI003F53590E